MKYFIDTEFKEKPNTIDLISIGVVCEDGREYYAICRDFLPKLKQIWKDEWIRTNVLLPIYMDNANTGLNMAIEFSKSNFSGLVYGVSKQTGQIRKEIIDFIGDDKPEFYGYYSDYDWVVFCWIFGRMIDLPKGFPMYCIDLKQIYDEKNKFNNEQYKVGKLKTFADYPKQQNEHNALSDAKWNYELYKFLSKL